MGDIVLVRIGTEVDGDPARVCPHMAQWWPLYTQLLKLKLGITLEIIQAAGSGSKSASTHVEGTAIDWRTWRFRDPVVDDAVELAREGGAPATWMRSRRRFGQPFDDHVHLALDCPCSSGADYQIAAVKAGFNGLGYRGRGGRDYHVRPAVWRNWSDGMAWIRAEIARLTPKPPAPSTTTTVPEEDDMPYTEAQLEAIVRKGTNAALWDALIPGRDGMTGSSVRNNLRYLVDVVTKLAASAGVSVDIDEAAIARDVANAILPTVREATVAAVTSGGTPDEIAEAVVAKLGTALVQG